MKYSWQILPSSKNFEKISVEFTPESSQEMSKKGSHGKDP